MDGTDDREPLVEVENVRKLFDLSQGIVDTVLGREPQPVRAVDGVSFEIQRGDTIGIAGESGCGKTTLGKLLVKLYEPTEGTIRFDGREITDLTNEEEREFRQRVQMIFQDPFESLNPRMTVFNTVEEPLKINDMADSYDERRRRVKEVLEDVGLGPADVYLDAFPDELSGGERQRVAIARALVVDPDFVVCDEPVSMLDVSIRAGVLNLMKRLQDEYGLTYLFISHDLSLIRYMCGRAGIMYLGNMIEKGPTDDIITDPKHPYSEALFDAVPDVALGDERRRANATGEVPSPRNPPSGCRYHPRCAHVIPPDDWTGSQDAFRRALQFKLKVERSDIGPETVDGSDTSDPTRELVEHGLTLDVPEEYRSETEMETGGSRVDLTAVDLPSDAREALFDAAEALNGGDRDAALGALDGVVTTVCEREYPEPRTAGSRSVECHLYGDDATSATDSGVAAAPTED
ncbi:ABC transporter ATP-binding protein [Candidatus Halobonum tyrrellensis]|uniref:Peptide ABC transporter ATPase n=1 Tax=Candidatus Halobonum tyrrellensis G22 TaxID=1324957 RepID=V4HFE0_9EURY|nr:ABC transporter ATP-binding protein [Candidatus Halobonum tyrrellensis]ESP89400.1 peptide ABC transporter ATPase [Candidatus Halobonum tyrrellensis G22]